MMRPSWWLVLVLAITLLGSPVSIGKPGEEHNGHHEEERGPPHAPPGQVKREAEDAPPAREHGPPAHAAPPGHAKPRADDDPGDDDSNDGDPSPPSPPPEPEPESPSSQPAPPPAQAQPSPAAPSATDDDPGPAPDQRPHDGPAPPPAVQGDPPRNQPPASETTVVVPPAVAPVHPPAPPADEPLASHMTEPAAMLGPPLSAVPLDARDHATSAATIDVGTSNWFASLLAIVPVAVAGLLLVGQRRSPAPPPSKEAAGTSAPTRPAGSAPASRPPPGIDGLLLLGNEALDAGDVEGALRWFETALAAKPKLPVAHLCAGLCLLALDCHEQAADAFRSAVTLRPDDPVAAFNLARVLAELGDHAEALDLLADVLTRFPELAEDVRDDAAFAGLRDHPHFLQLVGQL